MRKQRYTRNVGLVRVLTMIRLLDSPRTVAYLVRRFGVSLRTVWRDLRTIEHAGYRIHVDDPGPHRVCRYRVAKGRAR